MKFKDGIFNELGVRNQGQTLFFKPMTPAHILQLVLNSEPVDKKIADVEFGWSGLQLLCCDEEMLSQFVSKGKEPFAFEGIGYISFSRHLFDAWDKTVGEQLVTEHGGIITRYVAHLCSSFITPGSTATFVVQAAYTPMDQDDESIIFQVHIASTVDEGAWMGMFQIHTQELQAAKLLYAKIKGVANSESDIASALDSSRTLN